MLLLALLALLAVNEPVATVSCAPLLSCGDAPSTQWDLPACDEYDFNTALIESSYHGDCSALELLRRRYDSTFTYAERFRIAAALLGRIPDDRTIWNELLPHAENI